MNDENKQYRKFHPLEINYTNTRHLKYYIGAIVRHMHYRITQKPKNRNIYMNQKILRDIFQLLTTREWIKISQLANIVIS